MGNVTAPSKRSPSSVETHPGTVPATSKRGVAFTVAWATITTGTTPPLAVNSHAKTTDSSTVPIGNVTSIPTPALS